MAGMERFTQKARHALSFAHQEALRAHNNFIGAEHLLLGLVDADGGVASRVLRELGMTTDRVREVLNRISGVPTDFDPNRVELGAATQQVLEFSVEEARRLGHHYIGTEHILLGLVRVESPAMDVLRRLGPTADQIRRQTWRILNETPASSSNLPSYEDVRSKILGQVLIVHGHDPEAKDEVVRYVENLGLQSMVFEADSRNEPDIFAAEAVFVIILLTPDDFVVSRSDPKIARFRARQNAIYELGFFHGRLGQNRVCALFKSDGEMELELPSQSLRDVCVRLDSVGEWKSRLAKHMRAAGLNINSENIG